MNARQKLIAKLEAATVETLVDVVRKLNRDTSAEAIIVTSEATNILERKMTDSAFADLMSELESDLLAA